MSSDGAFETLVLGVGNILWADEGFGVRCVEAFAAAFTCPAGVRVMDGGTKGLELINELVDARRVLLFDATDAHIEPGSLIVVRDAQVPKFIASNKVSLHQTSMMELLSLAELMGEPLEAITLIGCQPVLLEDYGGGLTDPVAAQLPVAIERAVQELKSWGIDVRPSTTPHEALMPEAVLRDPYESERPSAEAACRIGDGRIVPGHALSDGGRV